MKTITLTKMIRYDLARIMGDYRFWLKIPLISVICFFSNAIVLSELFTNNLSGLDDILGIYNFIIHFDRFRILILIVLSAVYTSSYCVDINQNYLNIIMARVSLKIYAISRIVSNAIAIMTAYFLGVLLYIGLLSIWYPLMNYENTIHSRGMFMIFQDLPPEDHPVLIIVALSVLLVLSVIVLSNAGFIISSLIPDPFVTVSTPAILYFLLGCLTYFLPEILYYPSYSNSVPLFFDGIWETYFLKILVNLVGILVSGMIFYYVLKRKWNQNERS